MSAKIKISLRLFFFRKKFVSLYSKSKHHIAMKKFLSLMLLCATALGITSCSKHNIEINDLIGKWESTEVIDNGEKTKYECFTFEADGSCLYETVVTLNNWEEPKYDNIPEDPNFPEGALDSNIVSLAHLNYTYSLVDDVLYLIAKFDYPSISKEAAYIVSIKKNTLTLTNHEASTTYTRAN